jgi:hypothetical protein
MRAIALDFVFFVELLQHYDGGRDCCWLSRVVAVVMSESHTVTSFTAGPATCVDHSSIMMDGILRSWHGFVGTTSNQAAATF